MEHDKKMKQGLKYATVSILVGLVILGIVAVISLRRPPAEPKLTVASGGVFIENSGLPDLSKIIKQKNLEKNFVDIRIKIYDIIKNNYSPTLSSADKLVLEDVNLWVFLYGKIEMTAKNQLWLSNYDAKIGIAKTNINNYVAYAETDTEKNISIYTFMRQQGNKIFIKSDIEKAEKSVDVIRQLIPLETEQISYYDFDMVRAVKYASDYFDNIEKQNEH